MSEIAHRLDELLERNYGLRGKHSRLGGIGENFLIDAGSRGHFVLKLLEAELDRTDIELEQTAIDALANSGCGLTLPRIVPTRDGDLVATLGDDDLLRGRLLEYVDGVMWRDAVPADRGRFLHLGRTFGILANALAEIDHPASHRTHEWDATRALDWRARAATIEGRRRRQIVETAFQYFATLAVPLLPELPHGLIHGDLNDENLLVVDDRVAGIVDFADTLHNPTICELGVALAYLLLDEAGDPWLTGAALLGAYHQIRPLGTAELEVLYPLMISRLAVSVVASNERRVADPERVEWYATEERAWRALEGWIEVDPIDATRALAAEIESGGEAT